MKNFQSIFLILTCLTLFTQCKKSNEAWAFPDITTSGNNTFGCLVDGEEWTPKKSPNTTGLISIEQPLRVRYEEFSQALFFTVSHYYSETNYERFSFAIKVNEAENKILPGALFKGGICWGNQIDTTFFNEVEILRFSQGQRIAAGTFEFTVVSGEEDCQDTIRITDGRFDINYS